MRGIKKLIHEVHRRSLWQVLAIYVAGAWIAYEVIQSLTEGLGLPGWFPAFAIVLFIIGLPIVLATAFVQEGGPVGASGRGDRDEADHGDGGERSARVSESEETRDPLEAAEGRPRPEGSGDARRLLTWRNAIAGGVLAFALWGVIAAGWLLFGPSGAEDATERTIDRNRVAVLPFRVTAADSGLVYLREGMVDLLAAKLTGEAGPLALDPRTVIAGWRRVTTSEATDIPRDSAVALARRLGAGQALLGSVVQTGRELVLNASVLAVPSGTVEAQTDVQGPPDSLAALVDRLAARLLTLEAGEEEGRLTNLTTRSLPALRAYLLGQASYRRGRYAEAIDHFERGLDIDSTFALAGLGLASATGWFTGRPGQGRRGLRVAWAHRDRLSDRDRAYLIGLAGPNFPTPSSESEHLAAWQTALEAAPDRPELWFWVGDHLFHYGRAMQLDRPLDRAADAFRRAVALDSSFVPPLQHLIQVVAARGDTAEVRRLGRLYLERDSAGEAAAAVRWWMASALGDTATLNELRARFDGISEQNLFRIVQWSEFTGSHVEDAERASRALVERAATPSDRFAALAYRHSVLLNHGRPRTALEVTHRLKEVQPWPMIAPWIRTGDALFSNGDSAAAAATIAELSELADAPLVQDTLERVRQLVSIYLVERWRLLLGETGSARSSIRKLRRGLEPVTPEEVEAFGRPLILILEAVLATLENRPAADSLIAGLDSVMRRVPPTPPIHLAEGNLIAARLHAARGRPGAALAATRRRYHFWNGGIYLSTHLREEGRLAALTGDREAAIQAYRHYLALRQDPDPAVADEVERVRAELARLVGEPAS